MASIEELKQEATELGLSFNQNIGVDKLQAKIDEYYKSQETSGQEIQAAVAKQEAMEKSEEKSAVKGKLNAEVSLREFAAKAESEARKTRIVIVTDNDQRENNQTTVAVVNCSNEYFDLGTVYIPLNVPVEVRQGHINVLKETEIPLHSKNPKNGLNEVIMKPRYSVSYES